MLYFTVYVYVVVQTNVHVCVPLYIAKGIDAVALNKKYSNHVHVLLGKLTSSFSGDEKATPRNWEI